MIARRRCHGTILGPIRILYDLGTIRDLTDGQLLERFATEGNEVAELAFTAMVERHEAMVWRVCRAILRDEHAAEDAFQATFLVLVRKARTLWVQDSLGPWLHRVACRTASHVRRAEHRRQRHEQDVASRSAARLIERGPLPDPDRECESVVHEAVDGLPEKFRAPIVLCDLEGRTHQEAARCLGWPIGTVKTRQMRGRRLLRERLVRRGLGIAVVGTLAGSPGKPATAAVFGRLSRATVSEVMRQSARLATGSALTTRVAILAGEVLATMFWIKLRVLSAGFLAVAVAAGGSGYYVAASQEPGLDRQEPASQRKEATTGRAADSRRSNRPGARPAPAETDLKLRAQRLATRKAQALFEMARLTREVAEIVVEEYAQVLHPRDVAAAEGDIKLAESDLKRSEDRVEWARRMREKGYVSEGQKVSEELSHAKAKFTLEQSQSKRNVLVGYTREKRLKELRSEVEKARAEEFSKQAAWELERAKEAELERELGPVER